MDETTRRRRLREIAKEQVKKEKEQKEQAQEEAEEWVGQFVRSGDEKTSSDVLMERLPTQLQEASESSRIRDVAAILIIIGSILGVISGGMLVSANPAELAQAASVETNDVRVSGTVFSLEGTGVENATVTIQDLEDSTILATTSTSPSGRFSVEAIRAVELRITVDATEFGRSTHLVGPGEAQEISITLPKIGNSTVIDSRHSSGLGQSVFVGSMVGLTSIVFALFGFWASSEARAGKHYRRTLWLSGFAMMSRGLMFIGPTLILLGMVLVVVAKRQFAGQF
ncbi:MAG: hypothetical protein CL992_03815 [Euryarchaeota archaeon]|nr:hypothetical protein [Euryarchaeota archaeon]